MPMKKVMVKFLVLMQVQFFCVQQTFQEKSIIFGSGGSMQDGSVNYIEKEQRLASCIELLVVLQHSKYSQVPRLSVMSWQLFFRWSVIVEHVVLQVQ